jgi:hypothetical protein
MQKVLILALLVLLFLAVITGSVLGVGNKCPEQLYVRLYNEDSDNYLLKAGVIEVIAGDEMTVEVNVRDNDIEMLLSYPSIPSVTPTPTPTPSPIPSATPSPTPTPQFTSIRKWVEDRRYVTSEECGHAYIVKAIGQELCSSVISYGHNIISILGQTFLDTGMVYMRTGMEEYELIYYSGLDKYFLTHEEYVVFCIEAGINAGGTL